MATPKQTDPQYKLRLPLEVKQQIEDAASKNGRSMNAEIIWRIERYEEAHKAWLHTDAALSKLEGAIEEKEAEITRHYEERDRLYEAMNNQERSLQTLRETHRTLTILVKSLGEALLQDSQTSDFVKILAEGLAKVEIDTSSEASERLPRQPWED